MPGFVAQGVVEALDFDFNPYVKAKGTIPEPTDNQIAHFLREIKAIFSEARSGLPEDIDPADASSVLAAIDNLDLEAQIASLGKMAQAYAELCSDTPSAAQIMALPMRVRAIFFAWLQEQVMAPEAVTGGGQAQVTPLRGARAG